MFVPGRLPWLLVIIAIMAFFINKPTPAEDFSGADFKNYQDVPNIVAYLDMKPDDIRGLHEANDRLIFCFAKDFVYQEDGVLTDLDYAEMLETQGFAFTSRDATISNTFELENEAFKISIHHVSPDEEMRKEFIGLHLNDIRGIDKFAEGDENVIFDIARK
jgi:hypothetical protein